MTTHCIYPAFHRDNSIKLRDVSLAYIVTTFFPPGAGLLFMLREDQNGDFVGEFSFDGRKYEYHLRGYGKPVVITASMSPRYGSYAWRYIFEYLAGAYFVYSLDIEGMIREEEDAGHSRFEKLIEYFIREIVGVRSSIVAGVREYAVARGAACEARALVDRIVFLCPGGVGGFRLQGSTIAETATKMIGVPALAELRKITTGARVCTDRMPHSRDLPGGKSPLRVCEDIMRLLG